MKHKFQLLKTSWSIVVYIDINEILDENVIDYDVQITENLYIKLNWEDSLYKYEVLGWLIKAVKDVEKKIPLMSKMCFEVVELDYSESDFQEEGLYYVMIEWLAKRFNFELPPLDAYYDGDKNKYIFPSLFPWSVEPLRPMARC